MKHLCPICKKWIPKLHQDSHKRFYLKKLTLKANNPLRRAD